MGVISAGGEKYDGVTVPLGFKRELRRYGTNETKLSKPYVAYVHLSSDDAVQFTVSNMGTYELGDARYANTVRKKIAASLVLSGIIPGLCASSFVFTPSGTPTEGKRLVAEGVDTAVKKELFKMSLGDKDNRGHQRASNSQVDAAAAAVIEAWNSRPQRNGPAPAARAAEVAEVGLVGGGGTAVTGGGAAVHTQGDGSKVTDEGLMGGGSTA
jgi:hypothetical protein